MTTKVLHKEDIDTYDFLVAKWGATSLKCTIYLDVGGFKYTVIHNQERVFETNYLDEAIKEYNKQTDCDQGVAAGQYADADVLMPET